jgi:hypothetical protein
MTSLGRRSTRPFITVEVIGKSQNTREYPVDVFAGKRRQLLFWHLIANYPSAEPGEPFLPYATRGVRIHEGILRITHGDDRRGTYRLKGEPRFVRERSHTMILWRGERLYRMEEERKALSSLTHAPPIFETVSRSTTLFPVEAQDSLRRRFARRRLDTKCLWRIFSS